MQKITFDIFVKRSNKIHHNKYSYDPESYSHIDSKIRIPIKCPKHGIFWQRARCHVKGKGCKKCKAETLKKLFISNIADFIAKAKRVHGDKYDYSESVYKGANRKINIRCPKHGIFYILATNHLSRGRGCSKCKGGVALTTEEFVEKASRKFRNKYNYAKVNYKNATTEIIVSCPIHGEFNIKPLYHLQSKFGCRQCFLKSLDDGVSIASQQWLDTLNISSLIREYEILLNNKKYIVDAFDPTTNTIYEYYGKFWHGHPSKYNPDDIHPITKKTFGSLYTETLERQNVLKEVGFNLVTEWGP